MNGLSFLSITELMHEAFLKQVVDFQCFEPPSSNFF